MGFENGNKIIGSKLSPKQLLFCKEWIKQKFNGKKAAIEAGYSPKSAEVTASRLLSKAKVQEKIRELLARVDKKLEIEEDEIVRQVRSLIRSDIRDYCNVGPDGVALKEFKDLTLDQAMAVESVQMVKGKEGTNVKFKLHSKLSALDLAARIKGMLVEKHEHKHEGQFTTILELVKHANNGKAIRK
jgi:phage terminase small subunit